MKEEGPVLTETDLQYTKKVYDCLMFKKFFLNVLTANSCPLNALDMFT